MTEESIPVDLFNPGQVFACMGFLEAAEVLCGDAEGGFDWGTPSDVRFRLRAEGVANPFETVLEFLAEAKVEECSDTTGDIKFFPIPQGNKMALPVLLRSNSQNPVCLDHWTDGSNRNNFKLYAGNRSAYSIVCAMLSGAHEKFGVTTLWERHKSGLLEHPFDVTTPLGGSFNFDPRGTWTAIDVGYSPDTQKHGVEASPVVEILAAWGLQHARPQEHEKRQILYGAWTGLVTPMLARPALAGIDVAVPLRRFKFLLDGQYNKVVTFAQEEISK